RLEAERLEAERRQAEAARRAAPAATELRAISTPAPRYPPDALRSGTSGEVQVEFTVGVDGTVTAARVVQATPPRVFDREALRAVRPWRCAPVPAPVTSRRTINFAPSQYPRGRGRARRSPALAGLLLGRIPASGRDRQLLAV